MVVSHVGLGCKMRKMEERTNKCAPVFHAQQTKVKWHTLETQNHTYNKQIHAPAHRITPIKYAAHVSHTKDADRLYSQPPPHTHTLSPPQHMEIRHVKKHTTHTQLPTTISTQQTDSNHTNTNTPHKTRMRSHTEAAANTLECKQCLNTSEAHSGV